MMNFPSKMSLKVLKVFDFEPYHSLVCHVFHLRNCGDMGSGTCRGSESILFGWARDAPSLQLPKGWTFL